MTCKYSSILEHPIFEELKPYFVLEPYLREGGGSANPRYRIWVRGMPQELEIKALKIQIECSKCHEPINPIRNGSVRGLYLAHSCLLEERVACSRSPLTAEEHKRIVEVLLGREVDSKEQDSFDWG